MNRYSVLHLQVSEVCFFQPLNGPSLDLVAIPVSVSYAAQFRNSKQFVNLRILRTQRLAVS
jgi:hypothetical protein